MASFLISVAMKGKQHVAQLLIENNVRLDARNINQETALEKFLLQISSRRSSRESLQEKDIIHLLVSSGANVKFRYEFKMF